MKEIWKDIEGCEKIYQVSNKHRIKSLKRKRVSKDRILTQSDMSGYLSVHLRSGINKTPKVHILVANAFIPNPLNLPEINHKDGNKHNNDLSNLERCTSKENVDHAIRIGLRDSIGISNGRANHTEDEIKEIRRKYATGNYTQKQLGIEYRSCQSYISCIILKKLWKHI